MTGIKQKFVSLNLSNKFHPVNIVDGTQLPASGSGVAQATPTLALTDVLYILKFSINLLFINQFTTHNNCKIIFYSHCVLQDLSTQRRISSGHEKGGMYYLDDRVILLAWLQIRLIKFYSCTGA